MILVVYNRLLKIAHFIAITEGILAEELTKLFKDNIWKLYELQENIISDRKLQFVVELMKELNNMLEIKIMLSTTFYLQTDEQIEYMNQKLE